MLLKNSQQNVFLSEKGDERYSFRQCLYTLEVYHKLSALSSRVFYITAYLFVYASSGIMYSLKLWGQIMKFDALSIRKGPIFKNVVVYTIPIILTSILQLLFNKSVFTPLQVNTCSFFVSLSISKVPLFQLIKFYIL